MENRLRSRSSILHSPILLSPGSMRKRASEAPPRPRRHLYFAGFLADVAKRLIRFSLTLPTSITMAETRFRSSV